MNTAEDIKRMLGELVDEAIRIGRAEGEKTLGTDAQLKEQVKRLTDDKRKLTQSLDHVNEENNDLREQLDKLAAENDELDMKLKEIEEPRREPLPCPFCGGVPEVHGIKVNEFFVACPDENCPVNPETNVYPTTTEAVDAWNGWRQGQKTCDWR